MAISRRLEREPAQQASALSAQRGILMGLRYEEAQIDAIIQGLTAMLYGIQGSRSQRSIRGCSAGARPRAAPTR